MFCKNGLCYIKEKTPYYCMRFRKYLMNLMFLKNIYNQGLAITVLPVLPFKIRLLTT